MVTKKVLLQLYCYTLFLHFSLARVLSLSLSPSPSPAPSISSLYIAFDDVLPRVDVGSPSPIHFINYVNGVWTNICCIIENFLRRNFNVKFFPTNLVKD